MRFSPHRTVPDDSVEEIDPGFDSLSDEDELEGEDQFLDSSPMFLMNNKQSQMFSTPSKSPRVGRKSSKFFQSSPLRPTEYSFLGPVEAGDRSLHEVKADEVAVDELNKMFQDIHLKEKMKLLSSMGSSRGFRGKLRLSRPKSMDISSLIRLKENAVPAEDGEDVFKQKEQDIIGSVEQRIQHRSQEVQHRIRQIEEEKARIEAEKKRLAEEERKRAEDERKRQEQEQKRLEEEKKRREQEEAEKKKQEELKLAKEKEEAEKLKKQQQEAEMKQQQLAKEQEAKNAVGISQPEAIAKQFNHYKSIIADIKANIVSKVSADPAIKKACGQHKRKINPKFGQLTNSMAQLNKITRDVIELIKLTQANELAYKWILNFVSKAIVSQAETEVAVSPSSSVPLANLSLNLMCEFPELTEFLLARFVKKCPYVIGYTCEIGTEEGRLRMGWKRHEDKKWEDDITYDERMGGMCTLFSVITRLPLTQFYYNTHRHPVPIAHSWTLVARCLNTDAQLTTNTHYIVMATWWEACAEQLQQAYGKQADKVFQLLLEQWVPSGVGKFAGAKRLYTVLEDYFSTRRFSQFAPMEM